MNEQLLITQLVEPKRESRNNSEEHKGALESYIRNQALAHRAKSFGFVGSSHQFLPRRRCGTVRLA